MHFRQFYLGCLAHASYFIASEGEAVVVDPQRDVQQYLDEAAAQSVRIRYIVETHLHADFVSGHRELAEKTGAEIVFGAAANAEFPHRAVRDGDELRIGGVILRALETPGHTPESISWLVVRDGAIEKVLTGDTLFIGDVGRPDLAGGRGYTPQQMAGMLYDTLHGKLLALDDEVEVWPAHGAGSACGKNISKERSSTIGIQRRLNYALRPMTREAFVEMMTTDLAAPPRYFPMDVEINRHGARPVGDIPVRALTPDEVRERVERGAVVLDVRDAGAYGAGHLPGSLNIGLGGQYASWAGTLLDPSRPIVIVADPAAETQSALRLGRIGFDRVEGFLDGGLAAAADVVTTERLSPQTAAQRMAAPNAPTVIDVRTPHERSGKAIAGSVGRPLNTLPAALTDVPHDRALIVHCAGGYRSSIAASLLQREGFTNVSELAGGIAAWEAAGLPLNGSGQST